MNLKVHGMSLALALPMLAAVVAHSQSMPQTAGETLTGHRILLSDALHGHTAVLIASFSREAGDGVAAWGRSLESDPALAKAQVLQLIMLERAPGFLRGLIKNAMRKGMNAQQQERAVVLTADEPAWRSFFQVTTENDPYVMVLDATGRVVWHGHGRAQDLEPLVRNAIR